MSPCSSACVALGVGSVLGQGIDSLYGLNYSMLQRGWAQCGVASPSVWDLGNL